MENIALYDSATIQFDAISMDSSLHTSTDGHFFRDDIALNFCAVVDPLPDPQPLVVSIGPVTSKTAAARGLRVDAEAADHTIDGLVSTLLGAFAVTDAGAHTDDAKTAGGTIQG